jgi:spectinomycin phosphotransferase/16S rRNA (guanine(1405)-N(7))-methyltransferase
MLNPPAELAEDALAAALAQGWDLKASSLEYRPLGFGSHHWEAVDASGTRWFVTADELEAKRYASSETLDTGFARLRAALITAQRLREAGLGFVVATVPTADREPVLRVGERFAVALYPFIAGQSFEFGAFPSPEHRRAVVGLLVRLHTAPGVAAADAAFDDFSIPHRDELEAALDTTRDIVERGPYTRRAAELLAANAGPIRGLLDRYDGLVRTVRSEAPRPVPTHGEPHPGNTMRGAGGWLLIDWDTALLAPPERDLWRPALEDESLLAAYAAATGIEPFPPALELYRLRWDVADLAAYADQFAGPHRGGRNEAAAWGYMRKLMECPPTRDAAG